MTSPRLGISIDQTGINPILKNFHRFIKLMENPKPMWEAVGKRLVEQTIRRFYEQKDPKGKPWIPAGRNVGVEKSQAEGLRKGKRTGLHSKKAGYTLIGTGALLRSIKWIATSQGVEVGPGKWLGYAGYHNFGLANGEKVLKPRNGKYLKFKNESGWHTVKQVKIVQRQYLGWSSQDRELIRRLIIDYVEVCFNLPNLVTSDGYIRDAT